MAQHFSSRGPKRPTQLMLGQHAMRFTTRQFHDAHEACSDDVKNKLPRRARHRVDGEVPREQLTLPDLDAG